MHSLLTQAFLSAMLFGSVTAAVPLLLAGYGEQISEKAGVMNIGLEGMVLIGAYAGFVVTFHLGNSWLGFVAGGLAGAALAAVMAYLCVQLAMNQVIVGIALNFFAQGLTALLFFFEFSTTYPRLDAPARVAIPGLSLLPVLGPGLFNHHIVAYVALLFPILLTYIFRSTFFGLNLTSAGYAPAALDAAGVEVLRLRSAAVLIAGALAGVGGAYMSEVSGGLFVPFMSNGNGYIGIVVAMLARGRPIWVLIGGLVFGACLSATTALQVGGINVPTDIIQMLPFAVVMLILVVFGRRASGPTELGLPYIRGRRG